MENNDTYPPGDEGSDQQLSGQNKKPQKTTLVDEADINVIQNKKTGDFEEEITGVKIKRSVAGTSKSETHEYFKRTRTVPSEEKLSTKSLPGVEELSGKTFEVDEIKTVSLAKEKKKEKIEVDEDDDEGEKWDGSEAEIVLDDEAEEYEEETTGIKIKYALRATEVQEFIKHTEVYKKNRRIQNKHTIVQSVIFLAMLALSFIMHNEYYLWLAGFPVLAVLLIWAVPFFKGKQLVREMFEKDEVSVEIFPDKIEVQHIDYKQEIPLDGSYESEDYGKLILLFEKEEIKLIIPVRAIEPEFLADVQAMIFAGAKPRYKD